MYSKLRYLPYILWKKRPIHLTLFLTRRCNSRCPFCFYRGGEESTDKELSLSEIEKISLSFGSLLWLAFSGGEVFLREDLVDICKVFYRNNRPSIILISTNGLLSEEIRRRVEEILRYCRKSTIVLKLSIDGLGTDHDSFRGVRSGFVRTMKTYMLLKELLEKYGNFELGINTVFYSENQDKIEEIIEFVDTLEGIRTHTISLIRGEVPDKFKEIEIDKYLHAITILEERLRKRRSKSYSFRGAKLKAVQDVFQRRLIHETLIKKKHLIPCYAGRLNLVITERGDVYPCENFSEEMFLGNLREECYDLKKILSSVKAERVFSIIKDCYCTHECYMMTNIFFNPSLYPSLFKEYISHLF